MLLAHATLGFPETLAFRPKALTDAQEKEYLRLQKEEGAQQKAILELKEEENKATRELIEARHKADDDAKTRHEQARLKHELERRR
jgi:hypothetical protein